MSRREEVQVGPYTMRSHVLVGCRCSLYGEVQCIMGNGEAPCPGGWAAGSLYSEVSRLPVAVW